MCWFISWLLLLGVLVAQDHADSCETAALMEGAGRPAAGRPVLQGPRRNFLSIFFADKSLPPGYRAARSRPPGSGTAGVYSCKFRTRKYIFVKNENIKYKNIKTASEQWSVATSPDIAMGSCNGLATPTVEAEKARKGRIGLGRVHWILMGFPGAKGWLIC